MCPRFFHIYGPLWVNGYGFMIALGFLVFTYCTYRHPWRKKLLSGEQYLNTLFLGFLAAVVGGRFLFVIENVSQFSHNWLEAFFPWIGGFSLFGSVIAVLVIVPLYLKKLRVPILLFFDLIALYAPLLLAISRIGCFLAGCCYGEPAPLGFLLPVTFINVHGLAPLGVALYPTQLYSSLGSFLIFIGLYLFAKKMRKIPGLLIVSYLALASILRFTIDFWRGGRGILYPVMVRGYTFYISLMQVIVFGVFLATMVALFFILRQKRLKD